ncbi:MAG: hypothetical protein AAGG01_15410, partial [Planctomycetota bacterium]
MASEPPSVGPYGAERETAGPPWRWIALIALLGVAVRAFLAWAAHPLDIQSDEANYIYVALGLERFDVY